jgi:hypothetical protein
MQPPKCKSGYNLEDRQKWVQELHQYQGYVCVKQKKKEEEDDDTKTTTSEHMYQPYMRLAWVVPYEDFLMLRQLIDAILALRGHDFFKQWSDRLKAAATAQNNAEEEEDDDRKQGTMSTTRTFEEPTMQGILWAASEEFESKNPNWMEKLQERLAPFDLPKSSWAAFVLDDRYRLMLPLLEQMYPGGEYLPTLVKYLINKFSWDCELDDEHAFECGTSGNSKYENELAEQRDKMRRQQALDSFFNESQSESEDE